MNTVVNRRLPDEARMAVFDEARHPFRLVAYPLRAPAVGEVLVRVRMCTICRSDIHTWQGHRPGPLPGLLGHEIVGEIVALGAGVTHDLCDVQLTPGDRITWSEYFVPGRGYVREVLDLPQKSPDAGKYGHLSAEAPPHHHGGFAEYCYLRPDSWILKLPDILSDEEATPINCGVATMCAVVEAADIQPGDRVVIQGLGLLGLYGAALAKARGAGQVIGIEAVPERRALSARFGVDVVLSPEQVQGDQGREVLLGVLSRRHGGGADVVLETCGDAQVIPQGLSFLRPGGRYLLAGVVNPGAHVTLDAHWILRHCLTIRGIHNYHPRHLVHALEFILANRTRYPLHALVEGRYDLSQVNEAMADAAEYRVLRAAIVPAHSGVAHHE